MSETTKSKSPLKPQTKRQELESLRQQMVNEQSSFTPIWRDVADITQPFRARFSLSDTNRGDRRNKKIMNGEATLASRTLRAGMMSGITSPARPWFKLTTPDPDLAETPAVKEWLDTVNRRMSNVFLRSNLYQALPIVYGDVGNFSVAAMLIDEDIENVMRFYTFPIGSYRIANDAKLRVRVFQRDFRMTARQIVEKFQQEDDWSNISNTVKDAWDRQDTEAWFDICHIIRPNPNYDPKKLESKYKRFESVYYERGSNNSGRDYMSDPVEGEKFLSEKGYDYFPVLCPRWEVAGEDVYGTDCPGFTALGDNGQLQLMEQRHNEAIAKMIRPPMQAPTSLQKTKASILPGDITYVNDMDGRSGFRPVYETDPRTDKVEIKIERIEQRISRAYYQDLFLMLATSDRREITAREIDERHEEKLLALGPVLEQLNQDLLDPLIDIAFFMMSEQGMIPDAPEELQGMPLKVNYVSIMAEAQKLVGVSSVERFLGFVQNVAGFDQTVLFKVDTQQMVDVYGDILSIPPKIIRSDEDAQAMQAEVARAQQAKERMERIQMGAQAANQLAGADMSGDTALTRVVDELQPQ